MTNDFRPSGSMRLALQSASVGLASQLLAEWSGPSPLDAMAVLAAHPEVRDQPSIVIDLAYEEYCQRIEGGEHVDPEDFAARFPSIEVALRELLDVHRVLERELAEGRLAPIDWPQSGETYLGYHLLEELGRGGFSRVFLARERELGDRTVVVKFSARSGYEAAILGQLQHPHIIPVHSIKQDPETRLTALCMPFLGRTTLLDSLERAFATGSRPKRARVLLEPEIADAELPRILRRGSYIDGVLALAAPLCEALASAHARGIFHCDLKPSNVLLTPDGKPLLLDFNLSTVARLPGSNFGGTLPYMAPEQLLIMRQSASVALPVDARTDVFSMGVLLFQLLCGKLPFGDVPVNTRSVSLVGSASLYERHQAGPEKLSDFNPDVPPELERLLEQCLAFRPEARPQSATELAKQLRRLLSWRSRVRRWCRSHFGSLTALSLAGTLLLASVAVAIVQREPYVVREHQAAWTDYQEGDYEEAIERLDRVVKLKPEAIDSIFLRGRAKLKLGHWVQAYEDFQSVSKQVKDGRVTACLAYALSQVEPLNDTIIHWYCLATEQGFQSAGLANNLGYAYLQKSKLRDAVEHLERAIELNPQLVIAYQHRAAAELRLALLSDRFPDLRWIERAVELGPETAGLRLNRAVLLAASVRHLGAIPDRRPQVIHEILTDCERAVALGLPPSKLTGVSSILNELSQQPRFRALLARPPGHTEDTSLPPVVDPLADEDELVCFR